MARWYKRGAARRRGDGGPCVPDRSPVATRHLEAITGHVERHLGEVAFVIHEEHSTLVHVDVLVVAPRPGRDWWALVTSGMSDAPMHDRSCPDHPQLSWAELIVGLPADWRMDALRQERWAWPFLRLRELARYPHETDRWLAPGHTYRCGPVGGRSPFHGGLLVNPTELPEAAWTIHAGARQIELLSIAWMRREELDLAVAQGTETLLERVTDDSQLSMVLDPRRPRIPCR